MDSPLDLSISRRNVAVEDLVINNNMFSWSGMTEALSWSDQLLRVRSVMTISQLEQDWKDEEEVKEEEDQQPWRFSGQFEVSKPLEEIVASETEMSVDESRSLEVGQEFHIFGGQEDRSEIATEHFGDLAKNSGKPGVRGSPSSAAVAGEECQPVCAEGCPVELEGCLIEQEGLSHASEVLDESVGPVDAKEDSQSQKAPTGAEISAENQVALAPLACEGPVVVLGDKDGKEELEVTCVTLLPSSRDMVDGKCLPGISSQEVDSLVDGLALKDLVVIECQNPCEQADLDHILQGEEDSNGCQEDHNTLAEQAGHGLSQSELLKIDLFQRKVSSDSVLISEVYGEAPRKRTLEVPVLVQCWKVPTGSWICFFSLTVFLTNDISLQNYTFLK